MILYHGSPHRFSQFDITKCKDTCLEGTGIYFTPYMEVAQSYGNIIYTVEVSDLEDLTSEDSVSRLIAQVLQPWYGQYPQSFPYFQDYVEGLLYGDYSFSKMYGDLYNYLCESIYVSDYTELQDALHYSISSCMPSNYIYYDNSLGVVAVVRDTTQLRILEEVSYV